MEIADRARIVIGVPIQGNVNAAMLAKCGLALPHGVVTGLCAAGAGLRWTRGPWEALKTEPVAHKFLTMARHYRPAALRSLSAKPAWPKATMRSTQTCFMAVRAGLR
jgi:hypothetical protein